MKFNKRELLTEYLKAKNYTQNLKSKILEDFGNVENCLSCGAESTALYIVENKYDADTVLSENGLEDGFPEVDEIIEDDTDKFRRRIYVVDDAGDGIVLYERVGEVVGSKNGGKNGT